MNKIFQSIDIGAIISERLSAFKKLQENPNDIDAVMALGKVQEKVQAIALLHLINKNYDLFFKLIYNLQAYLVLRIYLILKKMSRVFILVFGDW